MEIPKKSKYPEDMTDDEKLCWMLQHEHAILTLQIASVEFLGYFTELGVCYQPIWKIGQLTELLCLVMRCLINSQRCLIKSRIETEDKENYYKLHCDYNKTYKDTMLSIRESLACFEKDHNNQSEEA